MLGEGLPSGGEHHILCQARKPDRCGRKAGHTPMKLDIAPANTAAQPAPVVSEASVIVMDAVMADLQKRRLEGIRKYGGELMTHNGRDALIDAYQEALDLVMYLRQAIMERE